MFLIACTQTLKKSQKNIILGLRINKKLDLLWHFALFYDDTSVIWKP